MPDSTVMKTRSRYAYAVVSVGFVVVFSIWLLNTTMIEQKAKFQLNYEWAHDLRSMIDRLEDLENFDNRAIVDAIDAQFYSETFTRFDISKERRSQQWQLATKLASEMSSIRQKIGTLNKAAVEKVLRNYELIDTATKIRIAQIVPWLSSNAVWPHWLSVRWVVRGSFSNEGDGGGGDGGGDGFPSSVSSYIGRLNWVHPSEVPRKQILSRQLLYTTGFSEAKQRLLSEWQVAWERLREKPDTGYQTAVEAYGIRLGLIEFPIIGGVLLVFLQVIFFLVSCKEKHNIEETRNIVQSFEFPTFGSPKDPLDPPRAKSLEHVLERAVWAAYLLMPISVMTIGLLTRYDLTNSRLLTPWYITLSAEKFWPSIWFAPRSYELSLGFDYLHLAALALAVGVTWGLTSQHKQTRDDKPSRNRVVLTICVGFLLTAAVFYRWLEVTGFFLVEMEPYRSLIYRDYPASSGFSVIYGCIWALTLTLAILKSRRFMAAISIAALMMFFAG